ncbi:DsrE family protein [Actinotalea sp. M2MS4P-6]|uniref:DsrE family protein n=1 Tax=Actinotalea sp. M2MS4P-6 TaxID=2983762 RepID=UPI0021E3A4CF|nr:DsrE family protein [Actinotalea sp. M2MS4P-6]MCV2393118.1 DsrE family protein [Actinotalea sp. M2MS4P-6]
MAHLLFPCSHAADDPERATIPLNAACVAAAAGHEVTVVCTVDAVHLGTLGGADGIAAPGMTPVADLVTTLVAAGGELWLCSACTGPRGITEADLRAGATIVGAATIVEAVAAGAQSITLA